nr:hypothetical protein CFP56_66268 [Quercus suber]
MGGSWVQSRRCASAISVVLQVARSQRCFRRCEIMSVWIRHGWVMGAISPVRQCNLGGASGGAISAML